MDLNEERVQKHVVVNTPGQRSEVLTERTERGPQESRVSASQANHQQPPAIVEQPAQQAPVIIQQQAPVIIQQPAPPSQRENTSANDDANMQDIATKRLTEDPGLAGVVMTPTLAQF